MSCRRSRRDFPRDPQDFDDRDPGFPHMNIYRCHRPGVCYNDCILLDPRPERGCGCRHGRE